MTAVTPRRQRSSRRRLSPDERREHLLELGIQLFGDSSFDSLSTEEIAERAGVSKGLLFHYFGSKRGYYVAVIRGAAERLLERSRGVLLSPGGGPAEAQRAQLYIFLAFVEENSGLFTLLMRSGLGVDEEVQNIVDESRRELAFRVAPHLSASDGPVSFEGPRAIDRLALAAWIGAAEAAAVEWADLRRRGAPSADRSELAELLLGMLPPALRVPDSAAGSAENVENADSAEEKVS